MRKLTVGEETFELTEDQWKRHELQLELFRLLKRYGENGGKLSDAIKAVVVTLLGIAEQLKDPEVITRAIDYLLQGSVHLGSWEKLVEAAEKTGVPLESLVKEKFDARRAQRSTPPSV